MKYLLLLMLPFIGGCNLIYDMAKPKPRVYQVKMQPAPYALVMDDRLDSHLEALN